MAYSSSRRSEGHRIRGLGLSLVVLVLALTGGAVDAGAPELEVVRQLVADDRAEEALDRLEDILAGSPADPEGLLLKGVLLAQLQQPAEARLVFLELIQRRPELPEAYNNLAALYGADGDSEQAIEVLKAALSTHESYATAYRNLTRLYAKMASDAYTSALGGEVGPGHELHELALLDRIGSGEPSEFPVAEPSYPSGTEAASCCGARRRNPCWW
jgi:tetratricopeptide (TPR) repeat protein